MKQLFEYIKTPQRLFAFLFLLLFPLNTVYIYSERFIHGYKWEFGTLAYYGIEVLGWAFVISLLVPMLRRVKGASFQFTTDRKFLIAALVFFLYSSLGVLWAIDSNLAQQQTTNLLMMFLVFLSLPMVLNTKEIVAAVSIGAVLPLGVGLYQFFSQSLFGSKILGISGRAVEESGVSVVQFGDERWLRAYGTFSHPNVFGGYLATLILSMVYVLSRGVRRWMRLWYMGSLLLLGALLILTMSRSAWMGAVLGVAAVIYAVSKGGNKESAIAVGKGVITLMIGMLFSTIIAWPLIATRVSGGTFYEIRSVSERAALGQQANDLFAQNPIVGVGAGNMTAALIEADNSKFGYVYQPVHNVFMLLLVEYGIIGMLLLAVLCYYFLCFVIQVYRSAMVLLPLVALLPLLLFDHYLWTSVHGLGIVAIVLAILLSPNDSSSENPV